MPHMPITIEQARDAKSKAKALSVSDHWPAAGIGIGQLNGDLAVKVNLSRRTGEDLPSIIDGVPVIYEVVGAIKKR